jgi:hypothetical protein
LLDKHSVSKQVRIKLIQIHFKLKDGEVFAARDVQVPNIGPVKMMSPVVPNEGIQLYGYHYFVNDDGKLAAYEYMSAPGPSLAGHGAFLEEFCHIVKGRGLQHKLGLSLRSGVNMKSKRELEFAAARTCIDVPYDIEFPCSEYVATHDTTTEFSRIDPEEPATRHSHHKHCRHCKYSKAARLPRPMSGTELGDVNLADEDDEGLNVSFDLPRTIDLAGMPVAPSSDLFGVVSYVAAIVCA